MSLRRIKSKHCTVRTFEAGRL